MSVAVCAAVLFVATPQQRDTQLLDKAAKIGMIKGLKVCPDRRADEIET